MDGLKLLRDIISPTLQTLNKIGAIVLDQVLKPITSASNVPSSRRKFIRFKSALLRVLQYISDCHRYPFDYVRARRAADLMRVVDPSDAEAHMRVALTMSAQVHPADVLCPFFHFCVFLFNRGVGPMDPEAAVVRRLVANCSASASRSSDGIKVERARFAQVFVPAVWELFTCNISSPATLKEDQIESISTELKRALDVHFSEFDGRHLVGILLHLICTAHPSATCETKIRCTRTQIDDLVVPILTVIAHKVLAGLKDAAGTARSRRKNRRRLRGKRRRGRTSTRNDTMVEVAEIAAEVLTSGVNLEQSVPMLGPFSFLCGYWAVQRVAPPPFADLRPLALLLQSLREILVMLTDLMEITVMLPFFNHLSSKLSSPLAHKMVLPALKEDDTFQPCKVISSHEILRGVKFHEVALASAVKAHGGSDDVLSQYVNNAEMGSMTYEKHASDMSRKHMRAFALRTCQDVRDEVPNWVCLADGDALVKVVVMTVQAVRISRLMRELERIRGGTLSREVEKANCSNKSVPHLMSPEGSPAAPLQECELDRRVLKKQRTVGSFSPTKAHVTLTTATATATGIAHVEVIPPDRERNFSASEREVRRSPEKSSPGNPTGDLVPSRQTPESPGQTPLIVFRRIVQRSLEVFPKSDQMQHEQYWRKTFSGEYPIRLL